MAETLSSTQTEFSFAKRLAPYIIYEQTSNFQTKTDFHSTKKIDWFYKNFANTKSIRDKYQLKCNYKLVEHRWSC